MRRGREGGGEGREGERKGGGEGGGGKGGGGEGREEGGRGEGGREGGERKMKRRIKGSHTLTCSHTVTVHRGKGEYYRLGTDNSTSVKVPQKVEGLSNRKVVQVAVGALHCLALTEGGEVRED